MIRVKHFVETAGLYSDGSKYGEFLDNLINNCLKDNPNIKVLDIKYTGNVSSYSDEGHDWNINDLSGSEIDGKYLMQSTGLFDKNGVEIFKGDVVTFEDADDIENVYINVGSIEWCQGGFTVTNRTTVTMEDLLDGDNLEVIIIGNIYENPDLMGG